MDHDVKKNDLIGTIIDVWATGAATIIARLKRAWLPLLLCVGIGAELVLYRAVFLKLVPEMLRHLKLVTAIVDALILVFTTMENVIVIIVGIIKDILSVIPFIGHHRKAQFTMHAYNILSTTEIAHGLTELAGTCPAFNSMPKIMSFIVKQTFNPYVCPVIRAMQPTILSTETHDALGWLSYNSDMYDATSCDPPTDDIYMWVCTGLGAGYLLLEIALPLLVLALIGQPLLKAIFKTLAAFYTTGKNAIKDLGF